MEKIVFYSLALIMIVAAIASVSSRKMLRSVIYLLFALVGVAGIFFLIDYNFLAAVELTVYAGGIIVLMIFSVLLVHHIEMKLEVAKLSKRILVAIACVIGAGVFISTIYSISVNSIFQLINYDLREFYPFWKPELIIVKRSFIDKAIFPIHLGSFLAIILFIF